MERSKQYKLIGEIMHGMDDRKMFCSDKQRVEKLDTLADSSYIRLRSL